MITNLARRVCAADAATVREWAFLGWIALGDLVKYLRRGLLWEALERLHEARAQVWRLCLWAVTQKLRYPVYGLTAALDHPEISLPRHRGDRRRSRSEPSVPSAVAG